MPKNDDRPPAPALLAGWMAAHGYSQGDVAGKTTIPQPSVSKHLRGTTPSLFAALLYKAVARIEPDLWLTPKQRTLVAQRSPDAKTDAEHRALGLAYALHTTLVELEDKDIRWRRGRVGASMTLVDIEALVEQLYSSTDDTTT